MESEEKSIYKKQERGHLSVDYTCMKWFSLEAKVLFLFINLFLFCSILEIIYMLYLCCFLYLEGF